MNKDEIKEQVGRPTFNVIAIFYVLFLLCLGVSPFAWIWCDFTLGIKLFMTGFVGIIITTLANKLLKKIVSEAVDEVIEKKPSFQDRLKEMAEKRK